MVELKREIISKYLLKTAKRVEHFLEESSWLFVSILWIVDTQPLHKVDK